MKQKKGAQTGQVDVFGTVHGLDKLVRPPEVIESEGLKVIHFAISEDDKAVPGWLDEVKRQARRLLPEVKSRGKPVWLTSAYQTKRRKAKMGLA